MCGILRRTEDGTGYGISCSKYGPCPVRSEHVWNIEEDGKKELAMVLVVAN